jgi:hypothetical protein
MICACFIADWGVLSQVTERRYWQKPLVLMAGTGEDGVAKMLEGDLAWKQ